MKKVSYALIILAAALSLACFTACRRPDPATIQHDWGEWEIVSQPSCDAEGIRSRACKDCKRTQQETVPALGHDYVLTPYGNAPTCENAGFEYYECSRCKNFYEKEVAALGHAFRLYEKQTATCVSDGYEVYRCSRCLASYTDILTGGHNFSQTWNYDDACHWKTCSACGETAEQNSHTFENEICIVCGYILNSTILEFEYYQNNSLQFTGFSEPTEGDIVIPSYFNGLPVVSVSRGAMSNFLGGKITLPDTVTDLSESPFTESLITGIYLGSGVTQLTPDSFSLCRQLSSIEVSPENPTFYSQNNCLIRRNDKQVVFGCNSSVIPEGVTGIGNLAFYGSRIETLSLPDSVTYLVMYAFADCTDLKVLSVGRGLSVIGEGAFSNCGNLESITVSPDNPIFHAENNCLIRTSDRTLVRSANSGVVPQNITAIGHSAFSGCTLPTEIVLPDCVQTIGDYAFYQCSSLRNIVLGNGVQTIGNSAFGSCGALREITLPGSVRSVGNAAFTFCHSLECIRLPALQSIGSGVFGSCENLQTLILCKGTKSAASDVFEYSSLKTVWCEDEQQNSAWNVPLPEGAVLHWGDTWHYADGIPVLNEQ